MYFIILFHFVLYFVEGATFACLLVLPYFALFCLVLSYFVTYCIFLYHVAVLWYIFKIVSQCILQYLIA